MPETMRDTRVVQTFAKLADTLVVGYDVVDLLQVLVDSCRDLLDTDAAGILLADATGELELVASTSEATRIVEMMQLGAEAGPCIECYRSGRAVTMPDISASPAGWARFRDAALEQGFASMTAIPLRLRETTIGTLNLLRAGLGELGPDDHATAQAFADVATIGIVHERALRESLVVQEQLQGALNSRIVIEQAKGVVSYTNQVDMDEAFRMIRHRSKASQTPITEIARQIVELRLQL
ncbi:ANTAR domain-containing protein [Agromyces sp. CFH 90414]|uniref:ANTAR domain-containing protein n=1 Tax=Agromyces agglutinans TaxID=2662258 RepID=A0A6I2F7P2_9MICO|nr:GAF and ANTAR domain-containing protein [Agromyces agglutinans]MRG60341.1 ANTAR domain-containing protein [Agromyces agglutinans]